MNNQAAKALVAAIWLCILSAMGLCLVTGGRAADLSPAAGALVMRLSAPDSSTGVGGLVESRQVGGRRSMAVETTAAALPPDAATESTLQATLDYLTLQLDVALSTRASQATVAEILSELDVALSTRASEATASDILAQLDVALSSRASELTASSIDSRVATVNTNLITIQGKQDLQTAQLTAINGNTDGLEALVTSTNSKIDTVNTNLGTVQTKQDSQTALLTTIRDNADDLEPRVGATNETAAASDTSTSGLNGFLKRLNQHSTTSEGKLDSIITQATAINANTDTQETLTGGLTESAPVSDTASSGLNGRAQRIAQNITTGNGKIDTVNSNLVTIQGKQDTGNSSAATTATNTGLINGKIANDYGASSAGIRVAAQVGNATGAASFGFGDAGAQTQHVLSEYYEGTRATYSAAISGAAIAASATDVFTITGSATKTVKITRISLTASTTAGSGLIDNLSLIKRSTADTAGTSTTLTNVPNDSAFAAGTATVRSYTANPTLGTAVGAIRAERVAFETTSITISRIIWDFGNRPGKSITIRGTSEVLAINIGAITITGGLLSADIEWTEE